MNLNDELYIDKLLRDAHAEGDSFAHPFFFELRDGVALVPQADFARLLEENRAMARQIAAFQDDQRRLIKQRDKYAAGAIANGIRAEDAEESQDWALFGCGFAACLGLMVSGWVMLR